MSFGGLLATALAGGAAVIGKQAGDDIEQGRKADLMRQQADIEEQMRMRLAENQERIRQAGVLAETSGTLGEAKLGYASRVARQVDTIKQENEAQERARIVAAGKGASGSALIANLIASGDLAAATATGKAMTSGDRVVGYGGKLAGPDGTIIVDNEEDKARADAIRAARAGGGGTKTDHFDEKEWDAARKPDTGWFKITDPTGTDKYVPQLSATFNRILSEARTSGALSPNQARSAAYDFTVGLQSRAEALMNSPEGKKTNLAPGAAVDMVLKRMQEAAPPKTPPTAEPTVNPPAASTSTLAQPGLLGSLSNLYGTPKDAVANARDFLLPLLEDGAKTGSAIEALRKKVRSGQALTPDETAMARRFGMGV